MLLTFYKISQQRVNLIKVWWEIFKGKLLRLFCTQLAKFIPLKVSTTMNMYMYTAHSNQINAKSKKLMR